MSAHTRLQALDHTSTPAHRRALLLEGPLKPCHALGAVFVWLCRPAGMRGAFGKPFGVCARVCIGQILLSIRCKDAHTAVAEEALRRAKFKFPGRQKIVVSRNWSVKCSIFLCGPRPHKPLYASITCMYASHTSITAMHTMCRGFTPYLRDDYLEWKREGRLVNDGVNAKASGDRSNVYRCVPSLEPRCRRNPHVLQLLGNHGPLDARDPGQIFEGPARLWRVPVHA